MLGEIVVWLSFAAVVLIAWTLYVSAPHGDDEDQQADSRHIDD